MSGENAYRQPVTLKNVLMFSVPTIVMTVFMSFYTMVDGLFVSNLIGTDALSAVNLTAPVISLVTAISTMLATGGSAVIMRKAGQQKAPGSQSKTSPFLIAVNVAVGLIMSGPGLSAHGPPFWIHEPVSRRGRLLPYLSEPLSDLYGSDPSDEQFHLVHDRRRKVRSFHGLFHYGRNFEYSPGLCLHLHIGYGDRRGSHCHRAGVLRDSSGRSCDLFQKRLPAPFCKARVPGSGP